MRTGPYLKLVSVLLVVGLLAPLYTTQILPASEVLAQSSTEVPALPTERADPAATPRPAATPDLPADETDSREPAIYTVKEGDTIDEIAREFDVPVSTLIEVNELAEDALIQVGQPLGIPGSDGSLPDFGSSPFRPKERGSVFERMTLTAQLAAYNSPYHRTTWVTYYGRPDVPIMGILGEHDIDDLVPLLREQAAAYDELLGPDRKVMPAFHLVYGMAVKNTEEDNSYLIFMEDEGVMTYIERAQEEGFGVILDIQIGALSPAEALERAFPFLKYDNVHLALDPEFAMSHPDQERPGIPIGAVTAAEINEAQAAMRAYMIENDIPGRRILVVHQFLDSMIENKEDLDRVYRVDLTITMDGFGLPWPKIGKYNRFVTPTTKFGGFKLFYQWDEPLLTEREVLGIDRHEKVSYINVTPNMIIYQ